MNCRNHVDVAEDVWRCARCMAPFCGHCLVDIEGRPHCADCKAEQLLDTRSGVDRYEFRLASRWSRLGAWMVDMILLMTVFAIFKGLTGMLHLDLRSFTVPLAFIFRAYDAVMLSTNDGQTFGKMALGIRVVRPDGSSISRGQAWVRVGTSLVLSCLLIVDYIPMFFTEARTTLHDMIARTRVIQT